MNHLYFGDCLDVLKELKTQYPQPFIDLIYIDPPFNSKRNYNVLFESMDMKDANAQKQAFADTWSNYNYVDTLNEIADIDKELYTILNTFHNLKSISDSAVAYLTTMAIRIWYMHKLLKDTGSFYLHCDSTMSHYLKLICDMIFGEKNHQNEISWKRTSAHSDAKKYSRVTDKILFY
ncbi:site-specific DNA-methyltransferase, partial [Thermococcus sp. M36]|uniref:DNA methyltransferase n=1 Tax=Thermococcus sp. M36 TaxID=1638261 RepID=UPI0016BD0A65